MQNIKFIPPVENIVCDTSYHPVPDNHDFSSPLTAYAEERINLPTAFRKRPLSTFMIEVNSDCMVDAFIPAKARLLIDRSQAARSGNIILASVHGQFLVRFLRKTDHKCWLIPANGQCQEMEVTPAMDMQIWGVVTAVFTNASNVRSCMV